MSEPSYVPAAPGLEATIISVVVDGRPTMDDVGVSHEPIVAWQLDHSASEPGRQRPALARPVRTRRGGEYDRVLIPMTGNRLYDPATGSTYSNLSDAKMHALLAAQDAWDRKHASKDAPEAGRR